jgi:hypothetical protein
MAVRAALLFSTFALLAGCMPPKRATMDQLVARSSFDLACPATELRLYHFGEGAKGVAGCGRRVTYVERCQTEACAWVLDSPAGDQLAWPTTPQPVAVQPAWPRPGQAPAAPPPVTASPPVTSTMRPQPPDWGF